jgi:hypothetical protein
MELIRLTPSSFSGGTGLPSSPRTVSVMIFQVGLSAISPGAPPTLGSVVRATPPPPEPAKSAGRTGLPAALMLGE